MMNIKRIVALAVTGVVLTGSAFAADLPKPDADDPAFGSDLEVTEADTAVGTGNFTTAADMSAKTQAALKENKDLKVGKPTASSGGTSLEREAHPQSASQTAPLKGSQDLEEVTLSGQIVGYESCTKDSTLALVETADGSVQRVQLGYRGGRLLKLTPFTMKGTMKTDDIGEYLDVSSVEYKDADPFAEYNATNEKLAKAKGQMAKKGMKYDRDAAYSHDNITSDQSSYLTQQRAAVNPADYQKATATGVKDLAAGTKVALTGRCVMTVSADEDIMEFWDVDMKRVNLRMNGLYVPLGQRCTILGVVQEDGTVSVDSMESIAV